MPPESPAPAPCCTPGLCLWRSRRWARDGACPALVAPLGMGGMALASPALSACPPLPPSLCCCFLLAAWKLAVLQERAGSLLGAAHQKGKLGTYSPSSSLNSVCASIEMLHGAAPLQQVLPAPFSRARLALCFRLCPAGLEVPKSEPLVLLGGLRWISERYVCRRCTQMDF